MASFLERGRGRQLLRQIGEFWQQYVLAPTLTWTIVTSLSSVIFLWLSLRGVNYWALVGFLGRSGWWILLAAVANLVNLWLRAVRWQVILKTKKFVEVGDVFAATMIGFMANNVLPARAGELLKVVVLANDEGLSRVTTFATVVVERLFDTLVLVVLVSAIVVAGNTRDALWMRTGALAGAAICIVAVCVLALLRAKSVVLTSWLRARLGPMRTESYGRAIGALSAFAAGLECLSQEKPGALLAIVATSALIWLSMLANVWLGVKALDLPVPLTASVVVLIAQSFGMLIPSGPANLGVYQYTTVASIGLFGVDRTTALGLSLVLHASRFFPTTIIGFGYLLRRVNQMRQPAVESGAAVSQGRA